MFVIGDQQHQGRVGIPTLETLHESISGPSSTHLAPGLDGPERADPLLHLSVEADHIRVLLRRQFQEGFVVGEIAFPLGCQKGEREPPTGQLLDDRLVQFHLILDVLLLGAGRPA